MRKVKNKRKGPNYKDRDRLTDTGALGRKDREEDADSRDRRDCYRSSHNDPAWYAQSPQLLADYASFPFGAPAGIELPASLGYSGKSSVPGVMALEFVPTIGIATDANSPINVAARNIYSYVRHANSGHSNYEAPDLMMYLVAMDSVYMFHSFMKRALGLVLDYSPTNRFYPAMLLRAMHLDPDDIQTHAADFRGFINTYAVKMGSMCVPNSMSYMARHTWMCEGLYVDDPATSKAQTYFYTPRQFYQYQEVTTSGVTSGRLVYANLINYATNQTTQLLTVADLVKLGNALLNPILSSEDFNIMSGDILKAFGAEGVVKVTGVLDGYMVLPVYNQEVLSQIENATIVNGNVSSIVQQAAGVDQGYLFTQYNVTVETRMFDDGSTTQKIGQGTVNMFALSRLLNMHHSPVSPADTMVATRLMATIMPSDATIVNGGLQCTVDNCGSEIVCYGTMYTYRYDSSTLNPYMYQAKMGFINLYLPASDVPIAAMGVNVAYLHADLSIFDWHPISNTVIIGTDGTEFIPQLPCIDLANYTVLSSDNVKNLHMTAMLSEFSVPQMGAFSKSV